MSLGDVPSATSSDWQLNPSLPPHTFLSLHASLPLHASQIGASLSHSSFSRHTDASCSRLYVDSSSSLVTLTFNRKPISLFLFFTFAPFCCSLGPTGSRNSLFLRTHSHCIYILMGHFLGFCCCILIFSYYFGYTSFMGVFIFDDHYESC